MGEFKIIVIDDEKDVGLLMKKALESTGQYTVFYCSDSDEGELLCRQHNPGVIFLDYVMPKRNGDKVIASLKADPQTRNIPIVLMSGLGEMKYWDGNEHWSWAPNTKIVQERGELPQALQKRMGSDEVAEQLGVTIYLRKPFSKQALLQVAAEIFEKKAREGDASDGKNAEPPTAV